MHTAYQFFVLNLVRSQNILLWGYMIAWDASTVRISRKKVLLRITSAWDISNCMKIIWIVMIVKYFNTYIKLIISDKRFKKRNTIASDVPSPFNLIEIFLVLWHWEFFISYHLSFLGGTWSMGADCGG